jgi:orotate phosphoribosyltransferase
MSSLDDLIKKAKHLLSEGHSPGQIADELSLSMETVTWLLTQQKGTVVPKDVHIDWTAVSGEGMLLEDTADLLLNRYFCSAGAGGREQKEKPLATAVVGIALSGIPLATIISVKENLKLSIYHPAKHSSQEQPVGSMSGNFAPVNNEHCIIIDDVITSGNTLREVIAYLKRHHAVPVAIWVIFDKRSIKDIDGVPVFSLFKVSRID